MSGFISHLDLQWADPRIARFLGKLASLSRVILFDKRGTGLSDPVAFFGKLTAKAIRRGVFGSVPDLIDAIDAYLRQTNTDPKPFVWTKTTDHIIEKVQRGRVILKAITH